jgi:hypothetical protein
LKEKSLPVATPSVTKPELVVESKPVIISNEPVAPIVIEDPDRIKLELRIFNLEKHVHESFMNKISKDCTDKDVKICESYIINELMKLYLSRNIKLDPQPSDVVYNYMQNFSLLSEEPSSDFKESAEMSEFKLANRRMSKFNNDLVQHKYKVYVDPDAKLFMMSFPLNPSFAMNELLKIYNRNEVELHTDIMFLERFKRRYKYVSSKKVDTKDEYGED